MRKPQISGLCLFCEMLRGRRKYEGRDLIHSNEKTKGKFREDQSITFEIASSKIFPPTSKETTPSRNVGGMSIIVTPFFAKNELRESKFILRHPGQLYQVPVHSDVSKTFIRKDTENTAQDILSEKRKYC